MGFEEITERWHVIDGFENYAITESGKAYSINPNRNGYSGLRELAQRGRNNPKRYLSMLCCKNNQYFYFQIHQLVGKYFVAGYFDGAEIDHKDHNKHNNHYTNLEWVTHKENLHRSYETMSPVRNYKLWYLIAPDGTQSPILKGRGEIIKYIQDNNLELLISMLEKHKTHRGYKLVETA